jgi:hypothetical protein
MNHTPVTLAADFKDAVPVRGNRVIERNVTLHEHPDGALTVAVLFTRHDKDSKQFSAGVRIVRREPSNGTGFAVTTWIPFERAHNRRLPCIPVARYSDKALAAADAENLDLLTAEPDWLNNLDLGPHQGDLY